MKLTYVVQRYGPDIRGGAEKHCREFASRLAARGWDIEVLTTCATDYRTWADALLPGTSDDSGVRVTRFPVIAERDETSFDALSGQVLADPPRTPADVQERWMVEQGPQVPDLVEAVRSEVGSDLMVFITYLYYTSYFGLRAAGCRSVLHPTAHDEAPIYLSMYDEMFRRPRGFVFYTQEEQSFVRGRFDIAATPGLVAGIGIDPPLDYDPSRVRERVGGHDRYVLYLGRLDAAKGVEQLCSFFGRYRERRGDSLELLLAGEGATPLPDVPGVSLVGTLSEQEKWDALAGAEALIHPSYHESFAATLLEAWSVQTPAIVNGYCPITVGHCRRADGGVWYRSYAEFEACLDLVLADHELRGALGEQGRRYVDSFYRWDSIIDRYMEFLEGVRARR